MVSNCHLETTNIFVVKSWREGTIMIYIFSELDGNADTVILSEVNRFPSNIWDNF